MTALRIGTLALSTVLLAGCSADGLDVDGFSPGACTDVAPALQELDQALRDVASEDMSSVRAAAEFEAAQDELLSVSPDADAPVQEAMTALVTNLGFLRIATDNGLDAKTPRQDVRTALDTLAQRCGGSASPSSGS